MSDGGNGWRCVLLAPFPSHPTTVTCTSLPLGLNVVSENEYCEGGWREGETQRLPHCDADARTPARSGAWRDRQPPRPCSPTPTQETARSTDRTWDSLMVTEEVWGRGKRRNDERDSRASGPKGCGNGARLRRVSQRVRRRCGIESKGLARAGRVEGRARKAECESEGSKRKRHSLHSQQKRHERVRRLLGTHAAFRRCSHTPQPSVRGRVPTCDTGKTKRKTDAPARRARGRPRPPGPPAGRRAAHAD